MSSIMNFGELCALGRYRWIVPLIDHLASARGARFVMLLTTLGIARETLVRTLEGGIEAGWIMRNPGHGHPLRPEYILTSEGMRIAITCQALMAAQRALGLSPTDMTRWSLPVTWLIADGSHRFNQIERALGDASPRALTQSLKAMTMRSLVVRSITDKYPPQVDYGLTVSGWHLAAALDRYQQMP